MNFEGLKGLLHYPEVWWPIICNFPMARKAASSEIETVPRW